MHNLINWNYQQKIKSSSINCNTNDEINFLRKLFLIYNQVLKLRKAFGNKLSAISN